MSSSSIGKRPGSNQGIPPPNPPPESYPHQYSYPTGSNTNINPGVSPTSPPPVLPSSSYPQPQSSFSNIANGSSPGPPIPSSSGSSPPPPTSQTGERKISAPSYVTDTVQNNQPPLPPHQQNTHYESQLSPDEQLSQKYGKKKTICCCCDVRDGLKTLAIIDALLSFACFGASIIWWLIPRLPYAPPFPVPIIGLAVSLLIFVLSICLLYGAAKDLQRLWETDDPDFTSCFQRTVLVWIPCGFIWLFAALEIYSAIQSRTKYIPWNGLNMSKCGITGIMMILSILELIYALANPTEEPIYSVDIYTPLVKLLTFALVLFLDILNRKHGIRTSGTMFVFWGLLLICEIPAFRTAMRNPTVHVKFQHIFPFVIEVIYFPLVVAQFLLNCWADAAPRQDEHLHLLEKPSPEREASFLSRTMFLWFEKLARRGYSKALEFGDLWDLNPEDSSKYLNPIFNNYWVKAVNKFKTTSSAISYQNGDASVDMKKTQSTKKPEIKQAANIFPIIIKANIGMIVAGAIFKFATDMLTFAPPKILDLLIAHVESDEPSWKGYFYAVILFVSAFTGTIFGNQFFYKMLVVGMRIRTTVVGAIYRKALRISNASREQSTAGEIVNLMSVDAQRLTELCLFANTAWSAPLQVGLSLYFLWDLLGVSVLAGVGVMILLIPINTWIGSKLRDYTVKQMKHKDSRIKLMNEILSGIKVLKLYAWENSFEAQIMKIRGKEMKVLKGSAYLNACFIFVWTTSSFLVSVVTFATYVLIDDKNILDAQKAFVSLTLFNIMRMPLNMLSLVIVYIIQAGVSIKRINKFLNSEEIDDDAVKHDAAENDAIIIEDGNFSWKEDTPVLKGINLRVKDGSLVAVVGTVGVGKSTLLSAILGEVDRHSGRVNTKGRIAYVAQQAWIQNATVRENILFGLPFESAKYDKVIECCALKPDLEILPASDKTEIGEKGINLSGGQKQRVALARATYNNANVYLLDDPLSAVDSHVGKHLFEKVIGPNGMLRRKTRLLVTHSVTFLPEVDQIIVLKDGEISETGTYRELLDKKGAFAEFLIQHVTSGDPEIAESGILKDLEGVVGSKEELSRRLSQITESVDEGLQMKKFTRQISALSQDSGEGVRTRRASKVSQFEQSLEQQNKEKRKDKLIEAEAMESGTVKFSIFVYYMKAIGWPMAVAIILFQLLFQVCSVGSNLTLSDWSTQGSTNGSQEHEVRDKYLGVYAGLGGAQGVAILIASTITAVVTLRASGLMHHTMLKRILKAPMSFFDTTPSGRIVNRFAKDVDVCDNQIPMTFGFWLNCLFSVIATLAIISYSTPIFVAVVVPVVIFYFLAQRYYVASLRQLRRLESVSRSPIYSHFGETLTGTVTIRAFEMQDRFTRESEARVDQNQVCYFPALVAGRYISVCLELLGNIVVLAAAFFAVMSRENQTPGLVGLSISYALQTTIVLNWLVKISSDCETNLVSVERLKEYGEVVQEADWETKGRKPSKYWPEGGEIVFDNYQVRYREGLDLVLNGLNCKINPGEKVGIVGRTGAGKSSLTLGLFRILESAGGSITIDGHDISKMGLHDLRKRLTIIPQDPVIFSGTLRLNLDPFEEHRDEEIWRALEQAHLKSFVKGINLGLEYELTEGGENLSVGQRQLVCLARALLRKTKILILDEATAAVDLESDDLIQDTIRKEFKDSTIVTIAHRLNTIMDYTRVMVLDKGQIREFDAPNTLMQNRKSMFYGMAKDAGLA